MTDDLLKQVITRYGITDRSTIPEDKCLEIYGEYLKELLNAPKAPGHDQGLLE